MIQEGVEFFPSSGRQTCSVQIQAKGVTLQDFLKERQVNAFQTLEKHQLCKDHPKPTKSNLGGKTHFGTTLETHFGALLVLTSSQKLTGDAFRAAAVRRGCVHTNKVLTPRTPS